MPPHDQHGRVVTWINMAKLGPDQAGTGWSVWPSSQQFSHSHVEIITTSVRHVDTPRWWSNSGNMKTDIVSV